MVKSTVIEPMETGKMEPFFGEWARIMIQVQMKKRDIGYRELTELFHTHLKVKENERNLRNKIARGTFSAGFFLMCMTALEVMSLDLSDSDVHGQGLLGKDKGG